MDGFHNSSNTCKYSVNLSLRLRDCMIYQSMGFFYQNHWNVWWVFVRVHHNNSQITNKRDFFLIFMTILSGYIVIYI